MSRKKRIKQFLLLTTIVFVVILAIELGVLQGVDQEISNIEVLSRSTQRNLTEKDGSYTSTERYSEFLGRELTFDERKRQRELDLQYIVLLYNNKGVIQDFQLPDGTWFLKEDVMCFRLSFYKDGEKYYHFFGLESEEIMARYRSWSEDSFCSYKMSDPVYADSYRYYQLVLERFYIEDGSIIPGKIGIYKVERISDAGLEEGDESPTDVELVDEWEYEVPKAGELDCYELAVELDQDSVTGLSYTYTCNGVEYALNSSCTLNEKYISLEERKAFLEDCATETYALRDRDLLGIPNYHIQREQYGSGLLGGEVTAVVCDRNVFYNIYQYLWKGVVFVLVVDLVVALGIAAIVTAVISRKRNIG